MFYYLRRVWITNGIRKWDDKRIHKFRSRCQTRVPASASLPLKHFVLQNLRLSNLTSENRPIEIKKHQDLLTRAVPKYGWWLNSNEIFKDGSRPPTLWIRFKATLLCSATCSILRSSTSFSGSFEKLLFNSFAIFWASLKQLYVTRFCRT